MADPTGLWQEASTLADLGELTAQWLEGRITHLPAYYAPAPAPETTELIPRLAAYNRACYVTTTSQPGVPFGGEWTQRAYVEGFADEATVDAIEGAFLGTRLVALTTPPGRGNAIKVPVTMIAGAEPCTWLGEVAHPRSIVDEYLEDAPRAIPTLLDSWQVEVFDPEWGRNDLLWARLDMALRV